MYQLLASHLSQLLWPCNMVGHGQSALFPPSIGSGRRPVGALPSDIMLSNPDVLDEGMCQSPGSPSVEDSSESLPAFDWSSQHTRLVKRIPRAARARAGKVFESCLRGGFRCWHLSVLETLAFISFFSASTNQRGSTYKFACTSHGSAGGF